MRRPMDFVRLIRIQPNSAQQTAPLRGIWRSLNAETLEINLVEFGCLDRSCRPIVSSLVSTGAV